MILDEPDSLPLRENCAKVVVGLQFIGSSCDKKGGVKSEPPRGRSQKEAALPIDRSGDFVLVASWKRRSDGRSTPHLKDFSRGD